MTTATKQRKTKTKGGTALAVADLKRALQAVAPAVPGRSPKPVLTNVLLSGETLSATDLELRIDAPLDCYDGPAMLLPHARLSAIVGELSDGDTVTLRPDGAACIVDGGRVTYRLPIEDAAEFPSAGEVDAKPIARLPADQFLSLVQSVKFATDSESSRYALGGVLVQWKAGMLSFVGTDGRRMCVAETEIDQATDDVSVIVPRRAVDVLCRLARHAEEVQLSHAGSELIATVYWGVPDPIVDSDREMTDDELRDLHKRWKTIHQKSVQVRARLVEGRFPRWTDVEPTRTVKASLVVVETLLHACRQAAICTSEQSRGVTFRVAGDELHLSSRSAEYGEASVTAELIEAGQASTVSLDPKFVVEWLGCGSFDGAETVELEVENAQSAVVLRAQDCRCVIMPLAAD